MLGQERPHGQPFARDLGEDMLERLERGCWEVRHAGGIVLEAGVGLHALPLDPSHHLGNRVTD
jgi:hypothetical protein